MDLRKKVLKKCWKHIKDIQRSSNMVDVSDLLQQAVIDTFNFRNMGLQKIKARETGTMDRYLKSAALKMDLIQEHRQEVISICREFIPSHMQKCMIYQHHFSNN